MVFRRRLSSSGPCDASASNGSDGACQASDLTAGKLTFRLIDREPDVRGAQWTTQSCPSGFSKATRCPDRPLGGWASAKQSFMAARTTPFLATQPRKANFGKESEDAVLTRGQDGASRPLKVCRARAHNSS